MSVQHPAINHAFTTTATTAATAAPAAPAAIPKPASSLELSAVSGIEPAAQVPYLREVRAISYGGLAECEIGPFTPGLNIVYGPNEAGKSTFASLIGGVLFGWESASAHGVRNTYRPEEGGRAGSLTWADAASTSSASASITSTKDHTPSLATLTRDEDGVTGDQFATADIDRATYDTVFSLTADELRSLRNSSDLTARLLTAGSGTASSPATAFVEIEQRIARTPVYQLETELEEAQDCMRHASERAKLYLQEDRELRELRLSQVATNERISALDEELEELTTRRAELEAAEARAEQLNQEREALLEEREALAPASADTQIFDPRLLALDSAAERVLRDRLDELDEERNKLDRALDTAKENSSTSLAAYEALCELDDAEVAASRRLSKRPTQAIVSVLLPIIFIAAGIPLFIHGREINSLSFTAFGIGLVVVAIFLAAAAFMVLFRQPPGAETLERRRTDAQWVMLQDRKKLETRQAEQAEFETRVTSFLETSGLAEAEGSIRQARSLLDEARAARVAQTESIQKTQALDLRINAIDKAFAEINATRTAIESQYRDSFGTSSTSSETSKETAGQITVTRLAALIKDRAGQREALLEAANNMSHRLGELERELDYARNDNSFEQAKFEYEQLRVRLREAKHELISLLLAKRMLERSIATWESQAQPEVHAQAGRLLATITDGRWVGIATSQTGSLVAVAADGTMRDPRHLSLGTCQQLYLALRIALLITATDVGRSVPVLCDDILVNFDADRRRGAAKALLELARHRQVIFFTCHQEIAKLLA